VAIPFNKFVIAMNVTKKQSHKNEFFIIFLRDCQARSEHSEGIPIILAMRHLSAISLLKVLPNY